MDLAGQRFGRWTVIRRVESGAQGRVRFLCLCDCGTECVVYSNNLRSGRSTGCGCRRKEALRISRLVHGKKGTAEYEAWVALRRRCHDATNSGFAGYGGRGITVCERWDGPRGLENFLADMGRRPSPDHSLDRVDNDGPYSPENCRWATRSEQQRNTRRNHVITMDGRSLTVAEWSHVTGISFTTICGRLRLGWSVERTLTAPVRGHRRKTRLA